MIAAQFIFETGTVTDEFLALDALIADAARDNAGFLGVESWVAVDGDRRNSIYYWQDQAALAEFARHPKHLEAKKRYKEWYDGFHVVVSEVTKSYGDSYFEHLTPNVRQR